MLDDLIDLPASSVKEFNRKGHACIRGLATPKEVSYFRPAIEETAQDGRYDHRPLEERDTYGRAFVQVHNLWQRNSTCKSFVFSKRFAQVAASLLGVDRVRLYHDQYLLKEPNGGYTPWHQDQTYWPLKSGNTVTMWMPLVEIPPEVGSMYFASGSHKAGNVDAGVISDESHQKITQWVSENSISEETYGPMQPGDATFHAGWTLHRAGPNTTLKARPVMTVIFVADGTEILEPTPLQEFDLKIWLGGQLPGDQVNSPMNPLLYP